MKKTQTLPERVIVKTWNNVGYHYTSWSNWLEIRKEGLIPYRLHDPELRKLFKKYLFGIWIWEYDQKGDEHAGSVIYQAATKQELKVVKLKVKYNFKDILRFRGQMIKLIHDGRIGNWYYHKKNGNVTSRIITSIIKPKNIELVKVYDLRRLLI